MWKFTQNNNGWTWYQFQNWNNNSDFVQNNINGWIWIKVNNVRNEDNFSIWSVWVTLDTNFYYDVIELKNNIKYSNYKYEWILNHEIYFLNLNTNESLFISIMKITEYNFVKL